MKHLGLDFGLKRLGLAISDPSGAMAFPLGVIERTTRERLFAELLEIIEREGVERIVLGLPRAPLTYADGGDADCEESECLTARQVRNFAESLARRTATPIVFEDESFTSAAAEAQLREAGLRGKKLKSALDAQAAVLILSAYLARQTR